MDAVVSTEGGTDHLLGAGLAARARDCHDRCAVGKEPPPRACQQPEGLERVVHLEERQTGDGGRTAAYERRRCSLLLCLLDEARRVEMLPFQRYKERATCQLSGCR